MPRPKGEPTKAIRVYADDAEWLTANAEATGAASVAEAFRALRARRGGRPVVIDGDAVKPATSGPTLHPPPGTGQAPPSDLARGGIVKAGTAIVGERGPEVIQPLAAARCSCPKPDPTPYGICKNPGCGLRRR